MKHIFEPLKMKHIELKNRLVRSATWEGIANQDGSVTEEAYEIYEELAKDGDFTQAEKITHTGALLVGTYDNFTNGDPSEFLRNLNNHIPSAKENKLIFIEKTGHTYQMKNQEVADDILHQDLFL